MKYVPSRCLLFRDTQNWDGLHPYPMAPFAVLDTGSRVAGGPRPTQSYMVLHGGAMAAVALGYCAALPYILIKGCSL